MDVSFRKMSFASTRVSVTHAGCVNAVSGTLYVFKPSRTLNCICGYTTAMSLPVSPAMASRRRVAQPIIELNGMVRSVFLEPHQFGRRGIGTGEPLECALVDVALFVAEQLD